MAKLALITGASAGIGEATALRLAKRGYDLILTARRRERLEALAIRCREHGSGVVLVHELDVTVRASVEDLFRDKAAELTKLSVLINNAGLAKGVDKMDQADLADWQLMVDTNVMGLLTVTRLSLPFIRKNQGHVVNIGSVAGHWTYPGGAVYCATKAAVKALTEGLRMDLMGTGIRVTNIEPGMVESEFSKVRLQDEAAAAKIYAGLKPLSPDDIAECIDWSLSRPAHVNVQEMIVFPTQQAGVTLVHRE